MKSLLNAFTKKEGKRKAIGSEGHGDDQLLVDSRGEQGTPVPPNIAGVRSRRVRG